jgi:import receptor subunit TOM20
MSRFTAVVATVGAISLGYAVYFDYSRRHNPEFRKKLRKINEEHAEEKEAAKTKAKTAQVEVIQKVLMQSLAEEPIPTDAASKEAYFMKQVTTAEQLAAIPGSEIESALAFYRALAVYPNPTDILNVYQNSVPKHIYEYVIMMMALQPPLSIASFLGDQELAEEAE